ncbi:cyclin-dependent kinase inhibitor 1-like [Hemiscyllium ocellatum]|uniref:cyclin-dependent kinase inhibitor 1-like n=1 Tax=Hemiscyllium ocellatum TaxID=170820 RepID=UPI0029661CAC|nr:cyclin-dependent kinase inhibitor 1-like [Hemiscyllium ocellatum]
MDDRTSPSIDTWRAMDRKPGRVCRSLFGPVDRGQVAAELRAELRTQLEAAKKQWAFDFEREQPVQGALQWEAVPSHAVPHFYRTSVRGGPQKGLPREAGERKRSPQQESNQPPKSPSRKRKQTVITDYYTMKRRFAPSGSESKP